MPQTGILNMVYVCMVIQMYVILIQDYEHELFIVS